MAKTIFLLFHGENCGNSGRESVAKRQEEAEEAFEHERDHSIDNLGVFDDRLHDRVKDEAHHGSEHERDDQGNPLNRRAVEELQAMQRDPHDHLAAVLAPFEREVILHGLLFLFRGETQFLLGELLNFLFLLADVFLSDFDKGILQAVQLEVYLHLLHTSLNLLDHACKFVHVSARHHQDQLLGRRVFGLLCSGQLVRPDEDGAYLVKDSLDLVIFHFIFVLRLWLDVDVVTDAKLSLNLVRRVQLDNFALRHNANSICQLISLLDVLGAHDDRASLFEHSYQIPDLLPRLHIESRGGLVQNNSLCLANEGHSERQFAFHSTRALLNKLVFVLSKLTLSQNLGDVSLLSGNVNNASPDPQGHLEVFVDGD